MEAIMIFLILSGFLVVAVILSILFYVGDVDIDFTWGTALLAFTYTAGTIFVITFFILWAEQVSDSIDLSKKVLQIQNYKQNIEVTKRQYKEINNTQLLDMVNKDHFKSLSVTYKDYLDAVNEYNDFIIQKKWGQDHFMLTFNYYDYSEYKTINIE